MRVNSYTDGSNFRKQRRSIPVCSFQTEYSTLVFVSHSKGSAQTLLFSGREENRGRVIGLTCPPVIEILLSRYILCLRVRGWNVLVSSHPDNVPIWQCIPSLLEDDITSVTLNSIDDYVGLDIQPTMCLSNLFYWS